MSRKEHQTKRARPNSNAFLQIATIERHLSVTNNLIGPLCNGKANSCFQGLLQSEGLCVNYRSIALGTSKPSLEPGFGKVTPQHTIQRAKFSQMKEALKRCSSARLELSVWAVRCKKRRHTWRADCTMVRLNPRPSAIANAFDCPACPHRSLHHDIT